jgi:hypothetical protein
MGCIVTLDTQIDVIGYFLSGCANICQRPERSWVHVMVCHVTCDNVFNDFRIDDADFDSLRGSRCSKFSFFF